MRSIVPFPCRTAVPLLVAGVLMLAGCENSLTEATPADLGPLHDLDCGDYGNPCEIDGIEVCTEDMEDCGDHSSDSDDDWNGDWEGDGPDDGADDCWGECGDEGGGGGGETPVSDIEARCPDCEDFTHSQITKLLKATEHLCSEGREPVRAAIRAGEYGARHRESYKAVRGWYHGEDFHDGETKYHYSINTYHPGWTGKMPDGKLIDSAQQLIELAGTLVHEYFHHKYPNETDHSLPGTRSRTSDCVAGLLGE